MVFAMPWVQVTLGVFTFTYAYTLAALGRVEDRVPDLHVGVAVLLNLACIVVFFLFVQRLSGGLRPSTMMQLVADRGREVIEQVYPAAYDPDRPEQAVGGALPASPRRWSSSPGRSGVVMAFSVGGLVRLARDADAVVELVPQVGDSVAPGDPLFRIYRRAKRCSPDALRGCVAVGAERTLDQDPRFAFRILVDIANRALSPAINDPTTAVLALDQIDNLLLCLGRRRLDEGVARDADGKLAARVRHPGLARLRDAGGERDPPLRGGQPPGRPPAAGDAGAPDPRVARGPPAAAGGGTRAAGDAVERGFRDEEDRKRAGSGGLPGRRRVGFVTMGRGRVDEFLERPVESRGPGLRRDLHGHGGAGAEHPRPRRPAPPRPAACSSRSWRTSSSRRPRLRR